MLPHSDLAHMPVVFSAGGQLARGNATAAAPPPRRILCYGDSLTVGFCCGGKFFEPYGRTMARTLGCSGLACSVSVCGLSGASAEEMLNASRGSFVDVTGCRCKGLATILNEDGP